MTLYTITSIDYILEIEKIDGDIIFNIIEEYIGEDITSEKPIRNPSIIEVNQSSMIIDKTIDQLEDLLQNGLKVPGTRHYSLLKLAILFYNKGFNKKDCEEKLIYWLVNQNKKLYKTPLKQSVNEIKNLVEWVFQNNVILSEGRNEIKITLNEYESFIFKCDKKWRLVLFALFVQSKRFADKDGNFFISYELLGIATGLNPKTVISHVNHLEKSGYIKIIKRKQYYFDGEIAKCHPNVYKILLPDYFNMERFKSENVFQFEIKSISDYEKIHLKIMREYMRLKYNL